MPIPKIPMRSNDNAAQASRIRHGHSDQQHNHFRAISEQIPHHNKIGAVSNLLPNFLMEDEDEKDSQQPS